MNTDSRRAPARHHGMTLVEVMMALAILGVSLLALMAGLVVAFTANGRASRRTQMVEFAQSRIDRLTAATRKDICTAALSGTNVDCSRMAVTGTFDPTAAPNAGGWMLDVLDRASSFQASVGVDQMAGPVVVLGDLGTIDEGATLTARTNLATDWAGGGAGCAATMVTENMLCRELHIEQTIINGAPIYRVWVRVLQGGAPLLTALIMQEDIAQ